MVFKKKKEVIEYDQQQKEAEKEKGETETVQIEPEKEEIKELTETEKLIIINSEIWYKAQIIELLSEILRRTEK